MKKLKKEKEEEKKEDEEFTDDVEIVDTEYSETNDAAMNRYLTDVADD